MFDDDAGDAGRSVTRIDGENDIFSRRGLGRSEIGPYPHYCAHRRNKIG